MTRVARSIRRTLAPIMLVFAVAVAPLAHAQSTGSCDDLSQQIDATTHDLDQLKNDSLPLLAQAQQMANVAPGETVLVASEGLTPLLTPATAATFGATATIIGARIGLWQTANANADADAYWRDLIPSAFDWYTTLATTAPIQPFVPSLAALNSLLSDVQLLSSKAQADQEIIDSLNQALQDCQATHEPPPPPPVAVSGQGDGSALCAVGGQAGYSNSQCFGLELDAATAVWTACTLAYFAAEDEAFRTGGDPPSNTCDGALKAATEAIQAQWGHP